MINIGQYIESAINWMMVHYRISTCTFRNTFLYNYPGACCRSMDEGRAWNGYLYRIRLVAYLWNGILGSNYANACSRFVVYLLGSGCRRAFRDMDGEQSACR